MYVDTHEYAAPYAYFKEEFGPQFAPTSGSFDTGYVDYRELAKRARLRSPAFLPSTICS